VQLAVRVRAHESNCPVRRYLRGRESEVVARHLKSVRPGRRATNTPISWPQSDTVRRTDHRPTSAPTQHLNERHHGQGPLCEAQGWMFRCGCPGPSVLFTLTSVVQGGLLRRRGAPSGWRPSPGPSYFHPTCACLVFFSPHLLSNLSRLFFSPPLSLFESAFLQGSGLSRFAFFAIPLSYVFLCSLHPSLTPVIVTPPLLQSCVTVSTPVPMLVSPVPAVFAVSPDDLFFFFLFFSPSPVSSHVCRGFFSFFASLSAFLCSFLPPFPTAYFLAVCITCAPLVYL